MKIDKHAITDDDRKGRKDLSRAKLGHQVDMRASSEAEDRAGRRPESNPAG